MYTENHQLTMEPIDDGSWRLCDRSVDVADADSLVAYIERRGAQYDVTWVHHGVAAATFGSLGELLTEAARVLAVGAEPETEGADA